MNARKHVAADPDGCPCCGAHREDVGLNEFDSLFTEETMVIRRFACDCETRPECKCHGKCLAHCASSVASVIDRAAKLKAARS